MIAVVIDEGYWLLAYAEYLLTYWCFEIADGRRQEWTC